MKKFPLLLALLLAPLSVAAADLKISQLTDGSTIQTTDQVPVNRGGANRRVVVGALAAKAQADLTADVTGVLPGASGGTGVANTGKTVTLGGNLTTSGANAVTLTTGGTTNVTLPTTGTLATLAGSEAITNKTSFAVAAGNAGPLTVQKHNSTYWYVQNLPAFGATSTNTTPLVNDTEYAMVSFASEPMTLTKIRFRTSSSNASVSAAIKVCIYAADGANGMPGTLLGSTASGTNIGDAAASTTIEATLDSATAVGPAPFWVAMLQTSSTGARFTIPSGTVPFSQYLGTTGGTGLAGSSIIYGHTVPRTYASGCVSPFGAGTINTTANLAPAFEYQVQ